MFTGIIGAPGTVESVQPVYDAWRFRPELHISLLTLEAAHENGEDKGFQRLSRYA